MRVNSPNSSLRYSGHHTSRDALPYFTQKFQSFNRRAASTGGVPVRHHVNWNINLLFALNRHTCPNLIHEPAPEFFFGLQRPATHHEHIRVENIHHLIKEQTQSLRLNTENIPAHGIALLRSPTHHECCLANV